MAEPNEKEILSVATHLRGALVPQPGPQTNRGILSKMTAGNAGNAGNIKLVYQIYRDIRLESAKSNSRETVFWTSLCSHSMKYFRKSIFHLLLQWIWRLGMCPWSWHCHPTVNEGSQLVERLGLPTCTCPRRSNDRSQSLHLGGRFSLHIRNGQSVSQFNFAAHGKINIG